MGVTVLLAKPLVKHPVSPNGDVGVPLGLLYLASYLRQKTPSVDVRFKPYRLERYLGVERDLEGDFEDVDVVASGGSTSEMPDVLEMFRVAKSLGKTTVVGGIFPSLNAEYLLRTGLVDYVVRGEGEEAFLELVTALGDGSRVHDIRGISYPENGHIVHNPQRRGLNLETLPLPAYDLAPMGDFAKVVTGSVYSARGCGKSCDFCTVSGHWQNMFRPRSIDSVMEEMRILMGYGFERIHFKDESMLQDRERAIRLFTAIKEADLGVKIKGKARLDEIDDELLVLLREAGVDMLHIGIESISYQTLQNMHKGLAVVDIKGALDNILDHGIGINPVYMFSWPGETPDDLRRNAEFIANFGRKPNVVTYISFITPHPGTPLMANSPQNGLHVLTHDFDRYTHKQPVAVPRSLGKNGLALMTDTYNGLSRELHLEHVNPLIDPDYVQSLEEACC